MQFACYCQDKIVEIKLLWPIRQLWLAYYGHGVILSASCLFDDRDCSMLYGQRRMQFACYCHEGIVEIKWFWPIRQVGLA